MTRSILLAVNGTLMRGLELNPNLLTAGATFVREAHTEAAYRLWSIGDRHPAMVRVNSGGTKVAVEVWAVVEVLVLLPRLPSGREPLIEPSGWAMPRV